jgi:catechol 2,3-dioxygenase-like lactoylglutathione lyase family enzyme
MSSASLHHVAFASRDLGATRHFYEDLLGFPLVHTEVAPVGDGFMRHAFFKLDDGSSVAFFELHDAGEEPGWSSAISTGNKLPVWVNHLALRADEERQATVRERMAAEDQKPMVLDHGWCLSEYYLDPNGILVELCRDSPGLPVEPERAVEMLTAVPAPTGDDAGR